MRIFFSSTHTVQPRIQGTIRDYTINLQAVNINGRMINFIRQLHGDINDVNENGQKYPCLEEGSDDPAYKQNDNTCSICLSSDADTMFGCSHTACHSCGHKMAFEMPINERRCHICREPINEKLIPITKTNNKNNAS